MQKFVFPELKSENGFLRARACWVYTQFYDFPLTNEHLKYTLDNLYANMNDKDLPVRVYSAIALVKFMETN